jgi:hypothetical protein
MSRGARWGLLIIALSLFGSLGHAAPAIATAPAPPPAPALAPARATATAPATTPAPGQAAAGYSASVLYNLANSFARAGKPGLAVLNYERARLLDPNDPDVEANLRHVRAASGLPPESPSRLDRLVRAANPRTLAWIGVLGLVMAGSSALARVRTKTHRRKLLVTMLIGICFLGLGVGNALALWPIKNEAVVIVHSTPVRVSPVTTEQPLFVLPEASIVSMGAEHDGFVLIQNTAGRSGWVQGSDLVPIVPRR